MYTESLLIKFEFDSWSSVSVPRMEKTTAEADISPSVVPDTLPVISSSGVSQYFTI